MSLFKQIVITALVLAAGFWGLVTYVPASLPILDRYGLLEPFGLRQRRSFDRQAQGPHSPVPLRCRRLYLLSL